MTKKTFFYFLLAIAFAPVAIKAASGDLATMGYDSANSRDVWRVNSSGSLLPGADNAYAIGASGTEVSAIYAEDVNIADDLAVTSDLSVAGNAGVGDATPDGKLEVAGDGTAGTPILLISSNNATTSLLRVQSGGAVVVGTSTVITAGPFVVNTSATAQVIGAGGTIADDACGGVKLISSASAVTTDTTNSFTAPSVANNGCCMMVRNVNASDAITIDKNALILLVGGANVVLAAQEAIMVCRQNSVWVQMTAALAAT